MLRQKKTRRDFLKITGATALGVLASTLAVIVAEWIAPALSQVTNQQVRLDLIERAVEKQVAPQQ